jgi:murein DD-endopeptidase MepM/ murein hydrolase activator NlpD
VRRALVLALVVGLLGAAGATRGGAGTFAVVSGSSLLPSAVSPNGPELILAPSWLTSPAAPLRLSDEQLRAVWQGAGQAYDVPWNVLAAINKIESNFGRNMGPSSAGAIGWMQFMPSTWERWGTDADGNGTADPWNPVDAIYSAARYLAASGARSDIRRAVFSYNHADWYVNEVLQLAQVYGGSDWSAGDGQTVFALDALQSKLAAAQAKVAKASDAYQVARANAEELATREQTLTARAESAPLLSDQLAGEKDAGQLGVDAYAAQAEAQRLERELDAARAALAQLQAEARSASFNQPAGRLLAAPSQNAGSYVFPVGGGPAVVSVSHFHHDYPAADIAAPEGTPVYALADATVLHAWSSDARCGIGFTMQTGDGQVWTYCHLSYLEPAVAPGAELRAGAPVGLVGATGHATGPHLHLQLQPATSYPQEQQWFQSFAGTAFRWQDGASSEEGSTAAPLVFHIVTVEN